MRDRAGPAMRLAEHVVSGNGLGQAASRQGLLHTNMLPFPTLLPVRWQQSAAPSTSHVLSLLRARVAYFFV